MKAMANGQLWPMPNPLVDRDRLIPEGHRIARMIAHMTGRDPVDVIAEASWWRGRSQRLHVMTDDRLAFSVEKLRAWERRLKGIPEPEMPR